jgi:deoxyribodipyrimidine photolyase-like uncharacterized protein
MEEQNMKNLFPEADSPGEEGFEDKDDAYVYGMSQYADGGLITTKLYVSSSNYLKNMSNYSSGEWKTIWDGLYWSFIYKNRELLLHNPRMALLKKYLKEEERL